MLVRALTALLALLIVASLVAAAAQPTQDEAYLEKARAFIASKSPLLAQLFDSVTGSATSARVSEENGVVTAEWFVKEGYEASARFVIIGDEPIAVSLTIMLPSEVIAQLGIGRDTLAEEAERAINAVVSSLPEWVGIREQRLPDDGVDISLTALSSFTIAVLDPDDASIGRVFKIFYLVGRTRYGYSVVLGDDSALLMAYLGGSRNPHITQPRLSVEEAREKAIEALTNVSKGEPRILVDGAFAIITPSKDIVPMYVVVANVMSGDYEVIRYMVTVNMEDGSVTIKSKKMYVLGGAGQQEAPDPQPVIEDNDNTLATTTQVGGDRLAPQESWVTGSVLPITFAVAAAAVIIVGVIASRR